MRGYLKWLSRQWVWMFILGSQVFVVALPSGHRLQYGFVLFWAWIASLNAHLSDNWHDMYDDAVEAAEAWEALFRKAKNMILNKQNPRNS